MNLHPKQQHIIDIYGKMPESLDEVAEAVIAVVSKMDKVIGFAWNVSYTRKISNTHDAPLNGKTNWGGRVEDAPRGYPGFYGRVWIRYAKHPGAFQWSDNLSMALTHTGTGGGGTYSGPWEKLANQIYKAYRAKLPANDDLFALPLPSDHWYSTDYRFFLDDWPGLEIAPAILAHELQEDKNTVWNKTAGKYYQRKQFFLVHDFEWNDPEAVKADEKFLEDFMELWAKQPET